MSRWGMKPHAEDSTDRVLRILRDPAFRLNGGIGVCVEAADLIECLQDMVQTLLSQECDK